MPTDDVSLLVSSLIALAAALLGAYVGATIEGRRNRKEAERQRMAGLYVDTFRAAIEAINFPSEENQHALERFAYVFGLLGDTDLYEAIVNVVIESRDQTATSKMDQLQEMLGARLKRLKVGGRKPPRRLAA